MAEKTIKTQETDPNPDLPDGPTQYDNSLKISQLTTLQDPAASDWAVVARSNGDTFKVALSTLKADLLAYKVKEVLKGTYIDNITETAEGNGIWKINAAYQGSTSGNYVESLNNASGDLTLSSSDGSILIDNRLRDLEGNLLDPLEYSSTIDLTLNTTTSTMFRAWVEVTELNKDGGTFDFSNTKITNDNSIVTINGVVLEGSQYSLDAGVVTISNLTEVGLVVGDEIGVVSYTAEVPNSTFGNPTYGLRTSDISIVGEDPNPETTPISVSENNLQTQQDVNWFLLREIENIEIPEIPDGIGGDQLVEKGVRLTIGFDDLPTDNLPDKGVTLIHGEFHRDVVKSLDVKSGDDGIIEIPEYDDPSVLDVEHGVWVNGIREPTQYHSAARLYDVMTYHNKAVNWTNSKIEAIDMPDLEGYVRKEGGDSMQGPLSIRPQDGANGRETSKIQTLGVFSNSEGSALRLGTTRDRVYVGHNDVSINGPLKVDEIQEKNAGGGIEITDRVILKTEGVEDDEVVTKKYIDDKTRHLQDEIVELEEEIDAIAPSVERGKWGFTAVGTVAQPGQFTMYDADFGNGSPTGLFKSAKSIWFNEIDLDGTPHSFANVKDGELLEIFIDGSPEYGLFSVTREAHDETATGSKFWVVDVDFVRTNESTTAVGPGETCRFKIFEAPSGGDATSFVMKTGDTMSGKLQLDKPRGDGDNGKGFSVKGAIGDTYSSTTVSDQAGELFQAYHNADGPDAINYKGKIQSPNNIVTKEYVDASSTVVLIGTSCKWRKGGLDESTLEDYQYFGIEKADTTSSQVGYGNVLYLNKLIAIDGTLQPLENYTPTDCSLIEVWSGNELWFKGLLDPTTYKVASRNPDEIVCDFTTNYPVVAKPSTNWSTSTYYKLILTGLVEKPSYRSRGDEVKMQPTVQKNVEDI